MSHSTANPNFVVVTQPWFSKRLLSFTQSRTNTQWPAVCFPRETALTASFQSYPWGMWPAIVSSPNFLLLFPHWLISVFIVYTFPFAPLLPSLFLLLAADTLLQKEVKFAALCSRFDVPGYGTYFLHMHFWNYPSLGMTWFTWLSIYTVQVLLCVNSNFVFLYSHSIPKARAPLLR